MAIVEVNLVDIVDLEEDFKVYGVSESGVIGDESSSPRFLFRARLGGQYIYFNGTPPEGATDVVVLDRSTAT